MVVPTLASNYLQIVRNSTGVSREDGILPLTTPGETPVNAATFKTMNNSLFSNGIYQV